MVQKTGNLAISGDVNLTGSRKVILLVDGGDLTINGRVNLQSSNEFFMTLVGKDAGGSAGNIIIAPTVAHPTNPALQGIYFAQNQFRSGGGNNRLYVKGSVVANGGFWLQRDLGNANTNTPAEFFEFDPALMFAYPRQLSRRGVVWREVAP